MSEKPERDRTQDVDAHGILSSTFSQPQHFFVGLGSFARTHWRGGLLVLGSIVIVLIIIVIAMSATNSHFDNRKLNNVAYFMLALSIYVSLIASFVGIGVNWLLSQVFKADESWKKPHWFILHVIITVGVIIYGFVFAIDNVRDAFAQATKCEEFHNLPPEAVGKAVKFALTNENQPLFNKIRAYVADINDSKLGSELIYTVVPLADNSLDNARKRLANTALIIIMCFFFADICGVIDSGTRKYFWLLAGVGGCAILIHLGLVQKLFSSSSFQFPWTQLEAFMGGLLGFLLLLQNIVFALILVLTYLKYVEHPTPQPDIRPDRSA